MKAEGLVRAFGISINRWQPANVLRALATDSIDSVQVVYNIFDQTPEDELFPVCRAPNIAVIARVPFDEGSLTGTLTRGVDVAGRRLPQHLLPPENLRNTLERVEKLRPLVPDGMTLPELALRHILQTSRGQHRDSRACASCGTSKQNLRASDSRGSARRPLDGRAAGEHRWDRLDRYPLNGWQSS